MFRNGVSIRARLIRLCKRAHYLSFWENSFLRDDNQRCEIWLARPDVAAQKDAKAKRKFASLRAPVTLKEDGKLADLYRYGSVRDDNNRPCPMLDLVVTVWGRVDSKVIEPAPKKCPDATEAECIYRPRVVLQSVEDVSTGHSKPACKLTLEF